MKAEVRLHRHVNPALRRERYSLGIRLTRFIFSTQSFVTWVWLYVLLSLGVTLLDSSIYVLCRSYRCPTADFFNYLAQSNHATILFGIEGYLLTVQVGALAVLSIAVSLVTLIGQNGNAGADVRVYYSESLTLPLVASSVALLLVLCIQMIWPFQKLTMLIGFPSHILAVPAVLTGIHLIWLALNLSAFAHFAIVSLSFGSPSSRARHRLKFTANQVVPGALQDELMQLYYANLGAPHQLQDPSTGGSLRRIWLGPLAMRMPIAEIRDFVHDSRELRDIWTRPFQFAMRSWLRRVEAAHRPNDPDPVLSFTVNIGQQISGDTIWCTRRGGLALSRLERFLVSHSFRFKRVR